MWLAFGELPSDEPPAFNGKSYPPSPSTSGIARTKPPGPGSIALVTDTRCADLVMTVVPFSDDDTAPFGVSCDLWPVCAEHCDQAFRDCSTFSPQKLLLLTPLLTTSVQQNALWSTSGDLYYLRTNRLQAPDWIGLIFQHL